MAWLLQKKNFESKASTAEQRQTGSKPGSRPGSGTLVSSRVGKDKETKPGVQSASPRNSTSHNKMTSAAESRPSFDRKRSTDSEVLTQKWKQKEADESSDT